MADFLARFAAGTTLETWSDPPFGDRPSRINPSIQRPHRYRHADPESTVTIHASVDGVDAPLDAALDERLFYGWFAERPSATAPIVTSPVGQSSVRTFTPLEEGHYTYVLRRQGGGGIILHLDVEER